MNDKEQALQQALQQITRMYGEGAVMCLGEDGAIVKDVETISTGSINLDMALGVGGVPRGRIVEIFGPESAGKSSLALHIVAEAQRNGGKSAFVDAEHALDMKYAQALKVDTQRLLLSQPDNGEQALEIAEALVRSGALDVVVVDSVAALVPRAEIEGEMGDASIGLQARLMSQAMRKLAGIVHKSNTCMVFINQIRDKIGISWGNPETTSGGRALKFYSSVRMDIRRIGAVKDGEAVIGNQTKVKIVKNKVAPPFREAKFNIIYGRGIDRLGELLDLAVEREVIIKSGTWYSYKEERLGQGAVGAKEYILASPGLLQKIESEVFNTPTPVVEKKTKKNGGGGRKGRSL